MNKKLVAAALGLAFAAPVFADASNVTVYGRVHQAIEHNTTDVDNANPDTSGNGTNIANYSSRLGVRGVEDLGGGLSAIFAYEFGAETDSSATNGSGVGTTRHAYLGFKGGFGTLVVGTQDGGNDSQAPLYNQASAYIYNINNNAGQLTVVGSGTTNDEVILRNQRVSNAIGYATTVAGVRVSARHALTGNTNQTSGQNGLNANLPVADANGGRAIENNRRETSVTADYTIGALTFGAGYERRDGSNAFEQFQNANGLNSAVKSQAQLGASYNFGAFSVAGLVAQQKYYGQRDTDTQYSVSTLVPLAANYGVSAMYAMSENGKQLANAQSVAAGAQDTDNTQFQVSAYYDFSKRTRAYAGFNRTTRETVPVASKVDVKDDSFVLGVRHNF